MRKSGWQVLPVDTEMRSAMTGVRLRLAAFRPHVIMLEALKKIIAPAVEQARVHAG
jgi:hypothetical protein